MKQSNYPKYITTASIWIIASLLFHLLILLLIMTYVYNVHLNDSAIPKINKNDQFVLFQQPTQNVVQPIDQSKLTKPNVPKQQVTKQPKQELIPHIIPGKQGINHQDVTGLPLPVQNEQKKEEEPKPLAPTPQKKTTLEPKQKISQTQSKVPEDINPNSKNSIHKNESPEDEIQKIKKEPGPISILEKLSPRTHDHDSLYKHVPKPEMQSNTKTASFQDINLGHNQHASNFGNSKHLKLQGNSNHVPQGDELKYITFMNQTANLLHQAIFLHPERSQMLRYKPENLKFHLVTDRAGKVVHFSIVQPSQYPLKNEFLTKAVTSNSLYHEIPSFLKLEISAIIWNLDL